MTQDPLGAKRSLAFIPDEPHLFEYLTVEEHLRFVGRLYAVTDASERIGPLLNELELSDKRDVLPTELSRCGLIHDPQAVLFDEPLTGLDPVGIRRMKETIRRRAQLGSAVILSSHLLHMVEEVCTRVLIIQRGRLVALGTISEIIANHPALAGLPLEEVFLTLTGNVEAPPG
jgi:ABC-2 type transport system ATP-binding protein